MRDVWLTIAVTAFMTFLVATYFKTDNEMGFSASKEERSVMEEVQCATQVRPQEDLQPMTDDDLRNKLRQFGEHVGPITDSTRRILEKKLATYLNVDCQSNEKGQGDHVDNKEDRSCDNNVNDNVQKVAQTTTQENGNSNKEDMTTQPTDAPCSSYFGVAVPAEITCPDAGKNLFLL